MLSPHWLDEVFVTPADVVTALTGASRFKEAVAKAQAAFYEAEDFLKKNPNVVGSSPAQQARVAFLEAFDGE